LGSDLAPATSNGATSLLTSVSLLQIHKTIFHAICIVLFLGFKAPSLYVQYQSAILELKPNADRLCFKDDSDAASTISSDEGLLQLISPKLLGLVCLNIAGTEFNRFFVGTGFKPGVIIASSMQSSGAVTLMSIVCQGGDDLSLMSEE